MNIGMLVPRWCGLSNNLEQIAKEDAVLRREYPSKTIFTASSRFTFFGVAYL